MTVGELKERLSSSELTEWMAYFSLEPFGYELDNYRTGVIAATIANTTPGIKKTYKPSDFFPQEMKTDTPDVMEEKVKMLAKVMNSKRRK